MSLLPLKQRDEPQSCDVGHRVKPAQSVGDCWLCLRLNQQAGLLHRIAVGRHPLLDEEEKSLGSSGPVALRILRDQLLG